MSKTTSVVLLLRVSSVLLMVVHHDIAPNLLHKINTLSFMRSAPRTLCMKVVLTWPAFATTVGFEVWERLLPADTASWSFNDGKRVNLSQRQREGLSIVRMQSPRHHGHTHPARCSHDRTVHHVAIQPIATTAHAMSVNTRAMFSR